MSRVKGDKFDVKDVTIGDIISSKRHIEELVDVGIIGLPYDGATRGRPGARFAPREVRKKLISYKAYCWDFDIDVSNLKIVDIGDLDLGFGNIEQVRDHILGELKRYLRYIRLAVILGGDHSVTYPTFMSAKEVFGREWGLIVFDAHHDLRKLEGGRVSSGTVINDIIESKLIDPENIVQIGIRGFVNSPHYVKKARELGIKVYTAKDVHVYGGKKVARDILHNLLDKVDYIYISFDVDSVDIAFAPGVNSPSSGGLFPLNIFELAFYLTKDHRVKIFDVVEYAPTYDIGDMTLDLVVNTILYALAGFLSRES